MSLQPLVFDITRCRYKAMIGTGGVGAGSFFALEGDQTLGREESRAGRFLDRRDYCKLHIISHYVKVLLGSEFNVLPASRVGDDETGHRLLSEMGEAGLDLRHMETASGKPTLFSFCLVYPDGSGGNLTTADAATATVDAAFIERLEPEFARWNGRGVALAAPEVPLEARQRLLELGTSYQFLRMACVTSEEARTGGMTPLLRNTDLLALNLDEAAAIAGISSLSQSPENIIQAVLEQVQKIKPDIKLSMTGGKLGSWCWDGSALIHTPILPVDVVSTAGAGDAHLSGVIAGLVAGLSFSHAHQLGAIVAACSVTSPDTIHKRLDRELMAEIARKSHFPLDLNVRTLIYLE